MWSIHPSFKKEKKNYGDEWKPFLLDAIKSMISFFYIHSPPLLLKTNFLSPMEFVRHGTSCAIFFTYFEAVGGGG
jgi:hypothetical protein